MLNELLVTYGFYRIGSVLVLPIIIVVSLLLFTPVGWLILGSIWVLSIVAKLTAEQAAKKTTKRRMRRAAESI